MSKLSKLIPKTGNAFLKSIAVSLPNIASYLLFPTKFLLLNWQYNSIVLTVTHGDTIENQLIILPNKIIKN